jgi:hypothetical protein
MKTLFKMTLRNTGNWKAVILAQISAGPKTLSELSRVVEAEFGSKVPVLRTLQELEVIDNSISLNYSTGRYGLNNKSRDGSPFSLTTHSIPSILVDISREKHEEHMDNYLYREAVYRMITITANIN